MHGNWPLANQEMAAALKFAKYDYQFEYGDGGHNGKHGGAILPESLRAGCGATRRRRRPSRNAARNQSRFRSAASFSECGQVAIAEARG